MPNAVNTKVKMLASKSDGVRTTRDGDQFHYLWAARKCLQLLAPNTDLVAISIEGPSTEEMPEGAEIAAGEEVIDVAEYRGAVEIATAKKIRYIQLKHSTIHSNSAWTMSGLAKTLKGFAKRYQDFAKATTPPIDIAAKISFAFVTNRPISDNVRNAIEDAIIGGVLATAASQPRNVTTVKIQSARTPWTPFLMVNAAACATNCITWCSKHEMCTAICITHFL